jgi:two-component sensor histidine kinase
MHWELAKRSRPRRFVMTWCESGGPMVIEPIHCGFGQQLIQQITAHPLGGTVTHKFLPEGIRWILDIPRRLSSTVATFPRGRWWVSLSFFAWPHWPIATSEPR